jgi:hypothetical protein
MIITHSTPQVALRRLIAMIVETGIDDTCTVAFIQCPLHSVPREPLLVVVKSEHIMIDIDLDRYPGQIPLTIEQEVAKSRIACLVQSSCFAHDSVCHVYQLLLLA